MKEVIPNDGCPFCSWKKTDGDKLFKIQDPDQIPKGSLFKIPRKNIRPCTLHAERGVTETLVNLHFGEWARGNSGNDISAETKAERRRRFEKFLLDHKIFNYNVNLSNKKGRIKLTHDAAMKIMKNYKEFVMAMEYPQPRDETWDVWNSMAKLFELVQKKSFTEEEIEECKRVGQNAMSCFVKRFRKENITKYVHILCSHLWQFQMLGLKRGIFLCHYSGKQLEACNLQDQKYFLQHSLRGGGKKTNSNCRFKSTESFQC